MPRFCLFTLTLALLLLAGCHAGRPSTEAAFAPVPGNILPVPNAFDYYAKAGAALLHSDQITLALDPLHPMPLAVQEHLVRENAPALALVREGFAFPYMNPAQRIATYTAPYYSTDRQLARLLRVEGRTKVARGDWNGAMQSDLDAVRLGQDIPRGSVLIGMLVGVACQSVGRRDVWDSASHLSAPQAKSAALRLESIAPRRVPYSDVMQQEEYFGQSVIQAIMHSHNWRDRLLSPSPVTAFDQYTRYMDSLIQDGRKPYALKVSPPLEPTNGTARIVVPILGGARLRDTDNQAQNALLTVTLALRAYTLEHGNPPDTLAALIPAYLSKMLDDPFALSGPLCYTRTGQNYSLYSVGPDGKDDGEQGHLGQHAACPHRARGR